MKGILADNDVQGFVRLIISSGCPARCVISGRLVYRFTLRTTRSFARLVGRDDLEEMPQESLVL